MAHHFSILLGIRLLGMHDATDLSSLWQGLSINWRMRCHCDEINELIRAQAELCMANFAVFAR